MTINQSQRVVATAQPRNCSNVTSSHFVGGVSRREYIKGSSGFALAAGQSTLSGLGLLIAGQNTLSGLGLLIAGQNTLSGLGLLTAGQGTLSGLGLLTAGQGWF